VPYLSASAVVIHYEEALYQVYATLPFTIFDLQHADDAAIPSHTAAGLQCSLDTLAATYQRAGLIVNTNKKLS